MLQFGTVLAAADPDLVVDIGHDLVVGTDPEVDLDRAVEAGSADIGSDRVVDTVAGVVGTDPVEAVDTTAEIAVGKS